VLSPLGVNHRYDLVVDDGGSFLRLQCKTGRLRNGTIVLKTQSVRSNPKGSVRRPYVDQIEFFAVYCAGTAKVYLVPVEEASLSECAVRVGSTANSQAKGIRWAAQYELPE